MSKFRFSSHYDFSLNRQKPVDESVLLPSLTQQQFRSECDINTILSRYESTGVLPSFGSTIYGDFSDVPSLAEFLDMSQKIDSLFDSLPEFFKSRFKSVNEIARLSDSVKGMEILTKIWNESFAKSFPSDSTDNSSSCDVVPNDIKDTKE
ncbi:internal scaffolding protein [Tortoise microvirus 50]|nr:internal scaffolding protein [Tortoise microvirus 50]